MRKTFSLSEKTITKLERQSKKANINKSRIIELALNLYCELDILDREEAREQLSEIEEAILKLTAKLDKIESILA